MADEPETTTSTTEVPEENQDEKVNQDEQNTQETVTTTVAEKAAEPAASEKQGEVAVDEEATANVVGDEPQQSAEDRLEGARQDALTNHAASVAESRAANTKPAERASE